MEKKYNCDMCNYHTNHKRHWNRHINSKKHGRHGEKVSYNCGVCHYKASKKHRIEDHFNSNKHKLYRELLISRGIKAY